MHDAAQVDRMQSYGIAPTAMTASHGYIASGAQRGMVSAAPYSLPWAAAGVNARLCHAPARETCAWRVARCDDSCSVFPSNNLRSITRERTDSAADVAADGGKHCGRLMRALWRGWRQRRERLASWQRPWG